MKFYYYSLVVLLLVSACKENEQDATPILPDDYGSGMYIVTENGISFYDGESAENQIYKKVNNTSIINPKGISINRNKAYVVGNKLYVIDINTFGLEAEISGFNNAVKCDIISDNRALVLDKGESLVKVVDLDKSEIISKIETGDSTKPVFIINNKSNKSFVLNGGGVPENKKDSTIIAIRYLDGLVPIADISKILILGDNPNSAVIPDSPPLLNVLCKGVYNPNDLINNTEASLHVVNQYSYEIYSSNTLSGIYNAKNLNENWNSSIYYFTAVGGIYSVNASAYNTSLVLNINSDVIKTRVESYADSDTTEAQTQMIYMNDLDNPGNIYKYDIGNSIFSDTIVVDGAIKDIAFY